MLANSTSIPFKEIGFLSINGKKSINQCWFIYRNETVRERKFSHSSYHVIFLKLAQKI